MRLVSAKIRNYRIHREVEIEFDRERTLIGGPNEAGKSTLIEAIHRALFLKAKGNTQFHQAMLSRDGSGHPEVELHFEIGATRHCVKKRFGGNGQVTLTSASAAPLNGDDAEKKLAELLSVEAATGKAVLQQWEHLWVWQGKACENPAAHASSLKANLLQRLQTMGAAAVLQSERDAQTAGRIEARYDALFTSSAKAKTGSPLDLAVKSLAAARQQRDTAAAALVQLEAAAQRLEQTRADLPQVENALKDAEAESGAVEARAAKLAEQQRELVEKKYQAAEADTLWQSRKSAQDAIAKLQAALLREEAELAPLQSALARLADSDTAARRAAAGAQTAYDDATEKTRRARQARDFAEEQHRLFPLRAERAQLTERLKRVEDLRARRNAVEEARGKLPVLTEKEVRKLEKLALELDKANATLASVATGVELLAAPGEVHLAGQPLALHVPAILTEEAEITTADGARLRITPGGGAQLAENKKERARIDKELRDLLAQLAVESVAKARELFTQREQLTVEIDKLAAQLEEQAPEQLQAQLAAAEERLAAAEGRIGRLRASLQGTADPADEAAARTAAQHAESALQQADSAESAAKGVRDATLQQAGAAAEALAKGQADHQQRAQSVEKARAELSVLVTTHGPEEARLEGIVAAESERKLRHAAVAAVEAAIRELQPDLLEPDRNRVKRSIEMLRERKNLLGNQAAEAQVTLRSEGVEDPHAALAAAETQLRDAAERHDRASREAQSVALLHRLFTEEQQSLSEQFTRPLAGKISSYLKCLFGESARASIELDEEGFSGLTITRDGALAGFGFGSLSGGTQEQTAAATRLAMAEVLAADHGGCLPVIFDDAFVYSDPSRVKSLQRMLDRAAVAGLQVIVLTCNPADYTALGAKQIVLERPSFQFNPATACASGDEAPEDPAPGEPPESADLPDEATPEELNRFLDYLRGSGGKAGNVAMREALGLEEFDYDRIKRCLLKAGQLVLGRGRGGSIALVESPAPAQA